MAKKCIICGGTAGSKEHVFPAALGGRRVCKSIFCVTHNASFSPLAAHLSKQFEIINSLLAVRPDHHDDPRTATVLGDNEEVVHLSGTGVSLVQGAPPEGGTRISLQFGGPEGLKAIGYVALTFFARYFSTLATYKELDAFKSYVSATGQGDYIWWEGPGAANKLPSNSFRFGHTISLQVSAADQVACARISLFASFNFMVKLGIVQANSDESVVVHINPQAELPKDILEERGKGLLFDMPVSSPGTENLGRMIKNGGAQSAIQSLFSKIHEWNLENATQPLFDELCALSIEATANREASIQFALRQRPEPVLRLLEFCVSEAKAKFADEPLLRDIIHKLDKIIERDSNSESGLTDFARICLEEAIRALAIAIYGEIQSDEFTVNRLAMLTAGGPGAYIVGNAIIWPVLEK